jgi:hypothetical protein
MRNVKFFFTFSLKSEIFALSPKTYFRAQRNFRIFAEDSFMKSQTQNTKYFLQGEGVEGREAKGEDDWGWGGDNGAVGKGEKGGKEEGKVR